MIIKFMRADAEGKPVEVEISRDDTSGEFIRIRRITILYTNRINRFKNDYYKNDDEKLFNDILREELEFLTGYEQVVKEILTPKEWIAEKNRPMRFQ